MLHLAPAALSDIRSAAQAGLTVTTHERRIHVDGYTGEGYIILDSHGNGSYMINGGMYGGILKLSLLSTLSIVFGIYMSGTFYAAPMAPTAFMIGYLFGMAGCMLALGLRNACFVFATAAMLQFEVFFLSRFEVFFGFRASLFLFITDQFADGAWDLCACDLHPTCIEGR